jgi:type II secretory pathway component PulF
MSKRADVFPKLLIHMVDAGEASGSLDIAFERMAVEEILMGLRTANARVSLVEWYGKANRRM